MGFPRQIQVQVDLPIHPHLYKHTKPPPPMMLPPPLRSSTIRNLRPVFKPLPAPMWCFDDPGSALRSSCPHLTSEHWMWTFGPGRDAGGQRVCSKNRGGLGFYSGSNLKKLRLRPRANALASALCPARACACAGGRRDLQGIEGRHVFILLLLESKIPRSKPDRDHVIGIPSRR